MRNEEPLLGTVAKTVAQQQQTSVVRSSSNRGPRCTTGTVALSSVLLIETTACTMVAIFPPKLFSCTERKML